MFVGEDRTIWCNVNKHVRIYVCAGELTLLLVEVCIVATTAMMDGYDIRVRLV